MILCDSYKTKNIFQHFPSIAYNIPCKKTWTPTRLVYHNVNGEQFDWPQQLYPKHTYPEFCRKTHKLDKTVRFKRVVIV